MSVVIWDPDHWFEINLANRLNFTLFDNAEIITGAYLPTGLDNFKKDTRTKIVLKHWWLWRETNDSKVDLSWADLVIFYTGEVINGPWDWYYEKTVEQFNNKNFICITEGMYKLPDFPKNRVYDDSGHWLSTIVDLCRYQECDISASKIKLFDALLGKSKPHRNFIFEQLRTHNLLDKSFVNIVGDLVGSRRPSYQSPDLHMFDDPAITDQDRKQPTVVKLIGLENGYSICHSIPINIYQNSWYSIVAETQWDFHPFITEKTAKPLYMKRLFVMFGAQGTLKKLHQQGYRTFNGVIDESYDQEPNDQKRWAMAFEQVLKLAQCDHEEVYREIAPILTHNHNHICDHHYRLTGLKNFLTQSLDQYLNTGEDHVTRSK